MAFAERSRQKTITVFIHALNTQACHSNSWFRNHVVVGGKLQTYLCLKTVLFQESLDDEVLDVWILRDYFPL